MPRPPRRAARRSPALAVATGLTALVTILPTAVTAEAGAPASLTATTLRTQKLTQALGIDDTTPELSWALTGSSPGLVQTAYRVQAATSPTRLRQGRPDLWDSGKVGSAVPQTVYAGKELGSRTRVYWRVMLWSAAGPHGTGHAAGWSAPASFETGLTDSTDWQADWITNADWQLGKRQITPVVVKLPRTTARYVRFDVTRLGLPLQENFPDRTWRLQLGEIDVRDSASGTTGLAKGAAVTASESNTLRKTWEPALAVDGLPNSALQTAAGYSSAAHTGPDVSQQPVTLTLDLKSVKTFDEVALYPRADVLTDDGRVPGFPTDYTVATADTPTGPFTQAAAITGQQPPKPWLPSGLPLFTKDFALPKHVRSARLYVSGLGIHDATINGRQVGDAVLEPANTTFTKRVQYATYDVTDLLRTGGNTVGVSLGNGISNVVSTADRYRKLYGNISDPKLIAQLEVTLADGTVRRITSGDDWRTTLGPTTSSNWYGGEDYDARRAVPHWDEPRGSRDGWDEAVTVSGPGTADAPATLSARETEPIRVVETLTGKEVPGAEGSRVFDLGRNIAGWPEITVTAPAGTTVRIVPAESLKDGHAFQSISNVGGPLWDSYTTGGAGAETWHPEYGYHGFRYLELKGLPAGATVTVRGKVLHTDNTSAGEFSSSDDLINGIHSIIRRSIEGNMMSVLTDCPSREKLGWLEQDQLVFPTLAANYDMESQLRKIVRDMSDGQTPEGLITSTTPEYTALPGGYRNDSNWGGAFVLVPWQLYTTYGDEQTLATYYPQMRKYVTFLEEKVSGGILDYGLGDWFTPDTTFPRAVAGTYGYWRVVDAMSRIAALLGDQDAAAGYRAKADASAKALADRYYDPATGTFGGGGGHGAEALALDMGAVPADQRERLLGHFVASVEAADFHLNLGEISLPAAFRVLSESGHDDVVGRIATQTTSPSYGYQVLHGNTTLGESWDGGPGQSQNHFMLGAIDAWFTARLAGIQQAPGSIGYRRLLVDPALVAGLTSASGSYRTRYGTVSTSWRLDGDAYRLRLTVPAGTTAEVHVPVTSGDVAAPKGARFVRSADGERIYEVGSGDWTFTSTYRAGA